MITIKTEAEIELLREGGRRLARIMRALTEEVKPGVSTADLNVKADEMISAGKDSQGKRDRSAFLGYRPSGAPRNYPASLCVSINDEVVHGIPNEKPRVIKEGDVVSLDLGLVHAGLYTDHAWTVGVGKISTEAKKLLEVTKKALKIGVEAVKPGGTTGDIGYAIQKYVESFKKSQTFGIVEELAGHGVGYRVHEDPFVPNYGRPGEGAKLKAGMVIAIEPMLTLGSPAIKLEKDGYTLTTRDHSVAAHFEHTVVITEKGAEVLTMI